MSKRKLTYEDFALDVSAWTGYVDRKGEAIANAIASTPTLDSFMPMPNVQANTIVQLPILSTSVYWSNADCVDSGTGATTSIVPRQMSVKRLTDVEDLCKEQLDAVLPLINKSALNTDIPFAELYMDRKLAINAKELEIAAWIGSTASGTGNLGKVTGLLTIAESETSSLGYYATASATAFNATNIEATFDNFLDNRPDLLFELDNVEIYVSYGVAQTLAQALLTKYGIGGTGFFVNTGEVNDGGFQTFMYKQTGVRIKGTYALKNKGIIAMPSDNKYMGFGVDSDQDNITLKYNDWHMKTRSVIKFNAGFQYMFPENVMYIKLV